jgi:cold shock CspA family protein
MATSSSSVCYQVEFDDLREGSAVTFGAGEGPQMLRVENVRPDGDGA